MTFNVNTLLPLDRGVRRVGRPRITWYQHATEDMWTAAVAAFEAILSTRTLKSAEAFSLRACRIKVRIIT